MEKEWKLLDKRSQMLIGFARKFKGATVYYREDWDCYYFALEGKTFGLLNEKYLTVKGFPEENRLLRQQYQDVIPGYHMNKEHWNSVRLTTKTVPETVLQEFIESSYRLVLKNFSKKIQQQISQT